jgi:hypothetical protein
MEYWEAPRSGICSNTHKQINLLKQKNYPKLPQTLTPVLSKNLGVDTQHPL